MVYVVGFSGDVVDMAGKRPNVVTIIEKRSLFHENYRMLVGMVDVIFAEIDCHPGQVLTVIPFFFARLSLHII